MLIDGRSAVSGQLKWSLIILILACVQDSPWQPGVTLNTLFKHFFLLLPDLTLYGMVHGRTSSSLPIFFSLSCVLFRV